jgi:transcriptional regulator
MYIPKHFSEGDPRQLFTLMQQYNFATLVTSAEGQLVASHLPFLVDADYAPHGRLIAHMARANDQWKAFLSGQEVLVIFQGPHAYITPSWYDPAPANVPTWNYAVVHAYGIPRLIENHAELVQILTALVDQHEAGFTPPWEFRESPAYDRMIGAVVGFEIGITRLEGKFKLSQNRGEADRERVIERLTHSDSALDVKTGRLMQERRKSLEQL